MSVGEMLVGGNVRGGKCPSGKCPSGMCLSGMCPSGKCPSGKCPLGMCPGIVRNIYPKLRICLTYLFLQGSFPGSEQPDQFFAAPPIHPPDGLTMSNAVVETIQAWGIQKSSIIGTSWDTTSSNTGKNRGSATLFENEMGRSLLWLACRHHIGELHIQHADEKVRGPSKGLYYYLIYIDISRYILIYSIKCMYQMQVEAARILTSISIYGLNTHI